MSWIEEHQELANSLSQELSVAKKLFEEFEVLDNADLVNSLTAVFDLLVTLEHGMKIVDFRQLPLRTITQWKTLLQACNARFSSIQNTFSGKVDSYTKTREIDGIVNSVFQLKTTASPSITDVTLSSQDKQIKKLFSSSKLKDSLDQILNGFRDRSEKLITEIRKGNEVLSEQKRTSQVSRYSKDDSSGDSSCKIIGIVKAAQPTKSLNRYDVYFSQY